MSIKIMSLVWDKSRHHGSALLLMLALADHADDKGRCWPGMTSLGLKTRMGRRNVVKLMERLEKSGEVIVEVRGGQSASNRYRVNVDLLNSDQTITSDQSITTHSDQSITTLVIKRSHESSLTINKPSIPQSPNGETAPVIEEPHNRKRTDRDIAVDELELKFSALSRLQKPDRKKKKSSGPTLWWNPLQSMWELCDKDTGRAWQLIEAAYKKLIEDKMTVSSPKSLLNTAIALHAQGNGRKVINVRC